MEYFYSLWATVAEWFERLGTGTVSDIEAQIAKIHDKLEALKDKALDTAEHMEAEASAEFSRATSKLESAYEAADAHRDIADAAHVAKAKIASLLN